MKDNKNTIVLIAAAMLALTPLRGIQAQALTPLDRTIMTSYQIGEQDDNDTTSTSADANQGPVRLARFSLVQGNITWRASDQDDWSSAAVNLPLRQGAQIWVTSGHAEVQFDDGSLIRLGSGSVVKLQTLYSDDQGEFTEIQLNHGLAALRLRHSDSVYQINTPFASVKSAGPSKVRIGAEDGLEVAVEGGSARVVGSSDSATLHTDDYLYLDGPDAPYEVSSLPDSDPWDRWNQDRDRELIEADTDSYVPANIAQVCGPLDQYGTWRYDPVYGHVWCPTVVSADWRPYEYGHWTWVQPFGWTWVSTENWGWAPYHYGSWFHSSYGWGWCPGPARQYWSPAVVNFCESDGGVTWCALSPHECYYPSSSLNIGFWGHGWSLNFSIGGCAVYYPHASGGYCYPHPWANNYVNHVTYVNITNNYYNGRGFDHPIYAGTHFVPQNAHFGGATFARTPDFGGNGGYRPAPRDASNVFQSGRTFAPPQGGRQFAGPLAVRPTVASTTPLRSFQTGVHPPAQFANRPTFRAPLPVNVARIAPAVKPFNAGASWNTRPAVAPGQTFGQSPRRDTFARPGMGITRPGTGIRPANPNPGLGANHNDWARDNSRHPFVGATPPKPNPTFGQPARTFPTGDRTQPKQPNQNPNPFGQGTQPGFHQGTQPEFRQPNNNGFRGTPQNSGNPQRFTPQGSNHPPVNANNSVHPQFGNRNFDARLDAGNARGQGPQGPDKHVHTDTHGQGGPPKGDDKHTDKKDDNHNP